MIITADTPIRKRSIQSAAYAADGQPDFSFQIPRPFSGSMFEHLRDTLGIDPEGFANQANQVFAENLGNNMASKIKAIVRANDEGKDDPQPLPTQADMDDLIAAYDFSGTRSASGESTISMSPLVREQYKLARPIIKSILMENGIGDKPAPVKVAKKDAEPTADQISHSEFQALVDDLVEGNAPWDAETLTTEDGEIESPFYELRREMLEKAEANLAITTADVRKVSFNLGR